MIELMIAAGMTEDMDYWSKEHFVCKDSIRFHIACDAHEDLLPRSLKESCRVVCQDMDFVDVGQFKFDSVSDALVFLTFFNNTQIKITEKEHVDLIDALPNNTAVCCGFGSGGCCIFPGENSLLVMYEFVKIRIKKSSKDFI